jgi:hypothetical protein
MRTENAEEKTFLETAPPPSLSLPRDHPPENDEAAPVLTIADLPALKTQLEFQGWKVSWKGSSSGEEELICAPKRPWTVSPPRRRPRLPLSGRRRRSRPAAPDPELWPAYCGPGSQGATQQILRPEPRRRLEDIARLTEADFAEARSMPASPQGEDPARIEITDADVAF